MRHPGNFLQKVSKCRSSGRCQVKHAKQSEQDDARSRADNRWEHESSTQSIQQTVHHMTAAIPHSAEASSRRKANAHNSGSWELQPACMTEVFRQTERRTTGERTEKKNNFQRRQRSLTILERRPASDAGRTNDHAVTRGGDESLRYEGAYSPQSIAQWCWTPPVQREQSTSLPDQKEKQNTLW